MIIVFPRQMRRAYGSHFVVIVNSGWIEIHPYKTKYEPTALQKWRMASKDCKRVSSVGTVYIIAPDFNPADMDEPKIWPGSEGMSHFEL